MAHQLQPQPPLDLSDVDLSQIDVGALVLAHAQLQQQVATLRSAEEVNVLQADRARALEENAALQATIARLEQVRLAQEQSALRPRTSTSTDPRRRPAEPGQTQPSQRASPADRERVHARQFPPTATSSPPARRSSSSGSQTSGLPPARATPRAAAGTRTAPPPVVPEARPSSAAASPHAASGTSSGSRAIPSRPSSARTAPAGVKKKQGQYQMTKKDFPKEAESCKNAFQLHIRFLWGYLDAIVAPPSAAESAVRDFQRRFRGKSVLQMRLQGKEGRNVIAPTQVKVGFDATEVVRSRNKIAGAFLQLEESGILHVRSYFAKLGIKAWAPDFTQTTYSL